MDENFDYDSVTSTVDEYAGLLFLDSIIDAAKRVTPDIFLDEHKRAADPIVELAYKLYMEGK